MSLVVMGISYKTADIKQRGPAAVPEGQMPAVLAGLYADEGVQGAVVLSTCNRVEVYLDAKTDRIGEEIATRFFSRRMGTAFARERFYLLRGQEAVRHTYRVVCSLDSQLLGEAQILGQMRRAYQLALDAGTTSEVLTRLFTSAFTLGKRVRTETGIGADSVSLSTTAYRVACDNVPDITRANVLLIGAGEMAQLLAPYLVEGGVRCLSVASRTSAHAQAFARETGAEVVPFERRYDAIAHSDVVFAMTTADEPVICADALRRALQAAGRRETDRRGSGTDGAPVESSDADAPRPLVLIDESVPRAIESSCAALPGVHLFDLDQLTTIVDEGMSQRMAAVPQVERLASQAEEDFLAWMQQRSVTPTIKAIHEKGSLIVRNECAHAVRALEKERGVELSPDERAVLAAYGNAVMKKILHGPTVRLRKEAGSADSYYYTSAARYLFGTDTYPPGTHHRRHGQGAADSQGAPAASRSVTAGAPHARGAADTEGRLSGKGERSGEPSGNGGCETGAGEQACGEGAHDGR